MDFQGKPLNSRYFLSKFIQKLVEFIRFSFFSLIASFIFSLFKSLNRIIYENPSLIPGFVNLCYLSLVIGYPDLVNFKTKPNLST